MHDSCCMTHTVRVMQHDYYLTHLINPFLSISQVFISLFSWAWEFTISNQNTWITSNESREFNWRNRRQIGPSRTSNINPNTICTSTPTTDTRAATTTATATYASNRQSTNDGIIVFWCANNAKRVWFIFFIGTINSNTVQCISYRPASTSSSQQNGKNFKKSSSDQNKNFRITRLTRQASFSAEAH